MATARWGMAAALLLSVLVSVGFFATDNGDATAQKLVARAECGTPYNDWVCLKRGPIILWEGGSPDSFAGAALRRKQKAISPFTKVRAEAGAEASVRFRSKASCELGPTDGPTEIVTRVDRESLFQQSLGYTSCRSLDGSFTPVGFFCRATGPCPVVFLSKGRFESVGPQFGGARTSSVSHLRVVIEACTRAFELRIYDVEPRTIQRETPEPTQYRIAIMQESEVTESGSGASWSMHEESISAPGICGQ